MAQRAKFFYLNYPNNPTGAVATPSLSKISFVGQKVTMWALLVTLLMAQLDFDGQAQLALWKHQALKDVGLNFIPFLRRSTWQAGESHLQLVMQTLLKP